MIWETTRNAFKKDMRFKNTKVFYMISFIACTFFAYIFWLYLRPVEIISIHQEENYGSVLVKNFPITDKEQINWWQSNKDMLKKRYNIPKPASYGGFTIIFWDYGDGYKEEGKYDRLCFNDLRPPKNCIDKNKEFYVTYSKNTGINFITNSTIYRIDKSGKFVKKSN